jgi:hypothetical protein
MRLALILGLAAGFASLPALAAGQKDPDAAGVQEAIRFEKAKQAAADRQARIEARGQEANTADRMVTDSKAKTKTVRRAATGRKSPMPQNNPQ